MLNWGRSVGKQIVFLGLCATSCYADLDSGSFGQEKMIDLDRMDRRRPFNIDGIIDVIGSSELIKKAFQGQKQSYSEGEIEAGVIFYFKECFEEGTKLTIGATHALFHWEENPFFDQSHFNYVSLELGFATKRFKKWLWQTNICVNVTPEKFNFNRYACYDFLLWGRREWSSRLGLHLGALSFFGMSLNKVYPILGFDWKISQKWQLNVIYPINIALVYEINKNWSAAAAGRFFFNRYRTLKNESLFEYRNKGAEIALTYKRGEAITANIHGGISFGSDISISNENHTHTRHIHAKKAPYIGGEVKLGF